MKKIFAFLSIVVLLLTACQSWKRVPDNLEDFVSKAEASASHYTEADWQKSEESYEKLLDLYLEHEDDYTPQERARVVKSIGRYHALMVVNGVNEAASLIKSLKEIIPSYLQGVDEVVRDEGNGILGALKGLLNYDSIEESVQTLMDDLEDLFDDVEVEEDGDERDIYY